MSTEPVLNFSWVEKFGKIKKINVEKCISCMTMNVQFSLKM